VARIRDEPPGGESTGLVPVHHRDGGLLAAAGREREVLTLVARGPDGAEIADSFGPSPLTAKTHVSRTMGELGARERVQLVIVAYESGPVAPGTLCARRLRACGAATAGWCC
jgi:DNA-binding NarL/FixJ family response regulator